MKLASYNIQFGVGLDGRYDPERIAASLAGADIIALQEVTRGFRGNQFADLPARFADLFPDHFWVFGAPCDIHLGVATENGKRVEQRFQFGNMILSRWPILSTRTLLLPRRRTFDTLNLQRGATEAVIDTPSGPLRVYSIHLDHGSPEERVAQIHYLKKHAGSFREEGGAMTGGAEFGLGDPPLPEDFVFLGDFNMVPESPEYVAMTGPVDIFYGRTMRLPHLVDALSHAGRLTAGSYSWMDPLDRGRRMHIDYGFLSCSLMPRLKDAFVDNAAEGSDHFPVWLDIA